MAAQAKLETAAEGLVMVRGHKTLVGDYQTRVPSEYTAESWSSFAKALTTATRVAGDASAAKPQVAAAKTALVTAVGELHSVATGTFQTLTNNPFWNDTSVNPIYSQGMAWVIVRRFGTPHADDAPRLQRTPCW